MSQPDNVKPIRDPIAIKAELPQVLGNLQKLLSTGNVRGLVTIAFMDNGDAVEASDTRLCSFYEMIGGIEAVKMRHLQPKL